MHSAKTLSWRLVVAGLALVLLLERDDLLLQGADQLQAGAVADVRQARVLVAAEVALADLAVLGAVEQGAVGLQLPDPVGRLLGVQLGHPPGVEELAAAHRVAEVHLQLSLLLTLPMLAAMPPSAMTVCALPNRDLQMIAVRMPASRASIAARRPAPPAPITTTS